MQWLILSYFFAMTVMRDAQSLCNYARFFFAGSLKSGNKRFTGHGSASDERCSVRNSSYLKANRALADLRANIEAPYDIFMGLVDEDKALRAGNCMEYTLPALLYGISKKMPNIWYADCKVGSCGFHGFLVLADTPDLVEGRLAGCRQFQGKGFCCCDPWMNIVCPMGNFRTMVIEKCNKWELEGKELYSSMGGWTPPTLWSQLLLYHGHTAFTQCTNGSGQVLYSLERMPPCLFESPKRISLFQKMISRFTSR